MKTITFIANLESCGGIETVFKEYVSILSPNYQINLISRTGLPDNIKKFCQLNNIIVLCRNYPQKPKLYRLPEFIRYKIDRITLPKKIIRLCQKSNYVIDFKDGHGHNLLKQISTPAFKSILWIHSGMPFIERAMQHIDFAIYDQIVCLTDSLKNKLIQTYPQHEEKFVRIYNPMNLESIKNKANELLPDIPKEKYFLHVSRIETDKDFQTLIDGYELFYRQTQSATSLYIIGSGSMQTYWQNYAQKQTAAAQIKFIGGKANPFPYMKKAKAVILSSPCEGFGCVLVEALCCTKGLVVSSDCPNGPREILGNGKYGLLFDVGNTARLAEILQQIDSGAISPEMFTAGLENHLQQFNIKNAATALHNLLS